MKQVYIHDVFDKSLSSPNLLSKWIALVTTQPCISLCNPKRRTWSTFIFMTCLTSPSVLEIFYPNGLPRLVLKPYINMCDPKKRTRLASPYLPQILYTNELPCLLLKPYINLCDPKRRTWSKHIFMTCLTSSSLLQIFYPNGLHCLLLKPYINLCDPKRTTWTKYIFITCLTGPSLPKSSVEMNCLAYYLNLISSCVILREGCV